MKKLTNLAILIAPLFLIISAIPASAQMMGGFSNSAADWDKVVEHTTKGEQEGKALWDKLQSKQVQCANVSDEDFDALGEYVMGTMTGGSHAAMNAMMIQMHGEQGEEQIHIVLGKRLSGCDINAAFPANGAGFMPMLQMMWGARLPDGQGGSSPLGFYPNNSGHMMNFGYGVLSLGFLGILLWFLWWIFVVAVIVWIARRLLGLPRGRGSRALEIVKERYAKGEITKEEFETIKKNLS